MKLKIEKARKLKPGWYIVKIIRVTKERITLKVMGEKRTWGN